MKKLLLIPLLLSCCVAYAGTGSGNDASLFYLAIIAFMSIILAGLYTVSFFRKIIKERKEKKLDHTAEEVNDENINTGSEKMQ
ncbi:MAG TPA: hypothetical protein PKI01_05065 [Bacteroidales bacterium]|nr:hypothetical protein [Bacteroidales bacterium]